MQNSDLVLAHHCRKVGDYQRLEQLCKNCLVTNRGEWKALELLAEACQAQNKFEDAETAWREVLQECPDRVEMRIPLAISLARQGKFDEAVIELRQVISLKPDLASAHHNLGITLIEAGKLADGLKCLEEAVRLKPDYVQAHTNLAHAQIALKQYSEALQAYRHVLVLQPYSTEALNGIGLALTHLNRWPEAVIYLQHALRLRPYFPEALNNIGLALVELGKFDEAEAAYNKALEFRPRDAVALSNLAACYSMQGRMDESLAAYDLAMNFEKDSITVRWNRSLALLQAGRLEEGFREYEWRWQRRGSSSRFSSMQAWDGSNLNGRTLLLWAEQGLGDAIQFIRYAPLLQKAGARVRLECPPPLVHVLSTCPGISDIVVEGCDVGEFDFHAPLMSLPRLCETTLHNIPCNVPYLAASPERARRWQEQLCHISELKVGISWQGNPHHRWDRHRSLPLYQFQSIVQEKIRLFSLQRGPGSEQKIVGSGNKPIITELLAPDTADVDSWAEIAAIMMNLDLVITVDTAIAHLAGAMGIKVWVLIAKVSDWRWLVGRQDSPWYPTMQLFRQSVLGDWAPVIQKMHEQLKVLLADRILENALLGC